MVTLNTRAAHAKSNTPALVTAAASLGPEATFMPVKINESSRPDRGTREVPTCKHDGVWYIERAGERGRENLPRRGHSFFSISGAYTRVFIRCQSECTSAQEELQPGPVAGEPVNPVLVPSLAHHDVRRQMSSRPQLPRQRLPSRLHHPFHLGQHSAAFLRYPVV